MGPAKSKSNQLRVRVTAEERELLEKLCTDRQAGETISDLVREAISLLIRGGSPTRSPDLQARINRVATLLKREPKQVEEACIEGSLDLIDKKCDVPLIVMETQLHVNYRAKDNPE